MTPTIAVLIGSQLLFSIGDLLARQHMVKSGFALSTFISGWFVIYFVTRTIAMFGQLYVFSTVPLGRTIALFGAVSIILANVLGLLLLREALSPRVYVGVVTAVLAFAFLALSK